jgi:hypothetical protein
MPERGVVSKTETLKLRTEDGGQLRTGVKPGHPVAYNVGDEVQPVDPGIHQDVPSWGSAFPEGGER